GSSHYYYPSGDYMPPLNPHPEETRRHDVTRLPVDPHSHLYEDVRDRGLYQDILASTLPSLPSLFDQRLPNQRNESRSKAYPQAAERARDVRQPPRDSHLPFEQRGELV
ncbi:hypothetical protein KUCAC02_013871, partial [Chaenocephalus aceratus]